MSGDKDWPTEISRTAEDYLKVVWAAREWGGLPATVKDLADRFGTTRASASSTVKRLAGQGLLIHQPYGPILLTPIGEGLALKMVRRHRLLETYLVDQLGYSWDEVHDEAENLEHAASDLMIERIDELLGNPATDPHGDPIPTREGHVSYPVGARRLSEVEPGDYTVSRISDDSADLLAWFEDVGFTMGEHIRVTARDAENLHIVVDGRELQLPGAVGDAIIVIRL